MTTTSKGPNTRPGSGISGRAVETLKIALAVTIGTSAGLSLASLALDADPKNASNRPTLHETRHGKTPESPGTHGKTAGGVDDRIPPFVPFWRTPQEAPGGASESANPLQRAEVSTFSPRNGVGVSKVCP